MSRKSTSILLGSYSHRRNGNANVVAPAPDIERRAIDFLDELHEAVDFDHGLGFSFVWTGLNMGSTSPFSWQYLVSRWPKFDFSLEILYGNQIQQDITSWVEQVIDDNPDDANLSYCNLHSTSCFNTHHGSARQYGLSTLHRASPPTIPATTTSHQRPAFCGAYSQK